MILETWVVFSAIIPGQFHQPFSRCNRGLFTCGLIRIPRLAVSQEVEIEFGRGKLQGTEMAHPQYGAVEFKRLFGVFAANHGVIEAVGFQIRGSCLGITAYLTNNLDLLSH